MPQYKIAVVIGSLRRESYNGQLADAVIKLAPPDFSFARVQIDDLPLYNQDDDGHPSEQVKRLKGQIASAQGLMFVTPEYNRSIPGVLKNAIDHASRPYGQNAWAGKPAGILGASVGAPGTSTRNSICATFWRMWTCRFLASPRRSSRSRMRFSLVERSPIQEARAFCKAGWTILSRG